MNTIPHDDFPDQTVTKPAPPSRFWESNGESAIAATPRFFGWLLAAFVTGCLTLWPVAGLCAVAAVAIALTGSVRGLLSLLQMLFTRDKVPSGFGAQVFGATLVNSAMTLFGAFVTMASTMGGRGRQLRRRGQVLLPAIEPGKEWATLSLGVTVDDPVRADLATQWRENGRTEHASVGAFARLTLDLMALGAPPALIASANRDALEEIRHTELCFSLARELDGRDESPGPFPEATTARTTFPTRPLALASLAVDSLVDGALHEGVSARMIARLAKVCEEPHIREVLREIAADEGRHAAHGWDVLEWCLAAGGAPVAAAVRGALRHIPETSHGELHPGAEDGAWQRYGIHGREMEAEEYAKARAEVIAHAERLLAA